MATREYMRFTRWEAEQGLACGWQFEVGWHRCCSGLEWAWYSREVNDGQTHSRINTYPRDVKWRSLRT